jgi:hypothetical protein
MEPPGARSMHNDFIFSTYAAELMHRVSQRYLSATAEAK